MEKNHKISTKKTKARPQKSEEHLVQIRVKDVNVNREAKPSKCSCCSKKYISLPISGLALIAVGSLLIMAYFSVKNLTSSLPLTQNTFPSYVAGGMMAVNGFANLILFKKRPKLLIVSCIFFTISSSLLCFAGAVHSLTSVAPMLSSFERCQYFPKETSCRCFYSSDLRQVSYIFRGTENCRVVQFDLKNMVYGISGVYGAGLAVCVIAGVLESLLLCPSRRSKRMSYRSRSEGDGKCTSTSRQSQTSQTNLTLSCSEAELVAGESSSTTSTSTAPSTQTRRESQTLRESQSACVRQHACSHYVVDLDVNVPRRDYCINYNTSSTRHDPPPPYTE
ncbi:uncharacterized protein LOC116289934 [Actinia tenebrosa]|uniref:Uncharacterized protein LOC116289934 n=1 Tax=Actinia tenebrosa TaxID=6105 RepID=A0A6P8H8H3_ACTTE|nr:uncharacterized protein LOC116289934 [Actinia tenebrosa]XP_031552742.1 uncharacterized protein LOC116289934 [Actinia tenebrosa]XP_031552743.1 uncharacterized protein LOC116289934 [Actinia tenebrosa]XP_031552744.1 uncharacterized protein LOC116289934 [Actinia tenebrosa]